MRFYEAGLIFFPALIGRSLTERVIMSILIETGEQNTYLVSPRVISKKEIVEINLEFHNHGSKTSYVDERSLSKYPCTYAFITKCFNEMEENLNEVLRNIRFRLPFLEDQNDSQFVLKDESYSYITLELEYRPKEFRILSRNFESQELCNEFTNFDLDLVNRLIEEGRGCEFALQEISHLPRFLKEEIHQSTVIADQIMNHSRATNLFLEFAKSGLNDEEETLRELFLLPEQVVKEIGKISASNDKGKREFSYFVEKAMQDRLYAAIDINRQYSANLISKLKASKKVKDAILCAYNLEMIEGIKVVLSSLTNAFSIFSTKNKARLEKILKAIQGDRETAISYDNLLTVLQAVDEDFATPDLKEIKEGNSEAFKVNFTNCFIAAMKATISEVEA